MDLSSLKWSAVAACFVFSVVSGAIWFGFVGSTGLANKLFAGYLKAWAIESGNHLLNFVVFGAIVGALR